MLSAARGIGDFKSASSFRGSKKRAELTAEERQELTEAFGMFDAEQTGRIDLHELKVLMRALGFQVKKAQVMKLVQEVNPSHGGTVDFETYLEIMKDLYASRDPEEEVRKAFALFDEDGTGKITLKNLKRVARELGETGVSEEELQAMIDEFDKDGDGAISQEDFAHIMRAAGALASS